jgi:hypothetical protein
MQRTARMAWLRSSGVAASTSMTERQPSTKAAAALALIPDFRVTTLKNSQKDCSVWMQLPGRIDRSIRSTAVSSRSPASLSAA